MRFLLCSCLFVMFVLNITDGNLVVPLSDKKVFVFNQFLAPCYKRKLQTRYENVKFYTTGSATGKFMFDYDFVVDNNMKTNLLLFKFKKCPSAENLDACSTFPTIKSSNFCGLMTSEKDVWSPMMMCATPKISCPYKKGIYRGRNCSIDMESFKFFPLAVGYWHLEAEILDDKKESVFCLRFNGYIKRA